jgi:3-phosphoshikimate 1-carboxyvinyltransferase
MVTLPRSKSMAARAMVAKAVTGDFRYIPEEGDCDDIRVLGEALNLLRDSRDEVTVNVGASGTALRFITAYVAATPGLTAIVTGTDRLCQRPMNPLITALRALGAEIEPLQEDGLAPLRIRGRKLNGGNVSVDAAVSSQFVSALLLVAPTFEAPLRLTVENMTTSVPYIDMTIAMMRLNPTISIERTDETITVSGCYSDMDYPMEPDWSAATFFYEYMALSGRDLRFNVGDGCAVTADTAAASLQSDANSGAIFRDLLSGAESIDIRDNLDMAPALLATIAMMVLPCRLIGTENLRFKESDRLAAMSEELSKISDTKGVIHISGHSDHRIAMAMAMTLPAIPDATMEISGAECVDKSFPGFWNEITKLGFSVQRNND